MAAPTLTELRTDAATTKRLAARIGNRLSGSFRKMEPRDRIDRLSGAARDARQLADVARFLADRLADMARDEAFALSNSTWKIGDRIAFPAPIGRIDYTGPTGQLVGTVVDTSDVTLVVDVDGIDGIAGLIRVARGPGLARAGARGVAVDPTLAEVARKSVELRAMARDGSITKAEADAAWAVLDRRATDAIREGGRSR